MNDVMPRERTPWITIILAILTFIAFVACTPDGGGVYPMPAMRFGGTTGVAESPGMPSVMDQGMSGVVAPDYYPYPDDDVPATDTREFLKISYHAQILTRKVEDVARRVETIVRGYDGRIDQMSSAHRFGFVRFVVPASQFDAFRSEIEGLIGPRFIDVEISSQNLLPQKISIEERQKLVEDAIAAANDARAKLVAAHANRVQSLEGEIASMKAQISDLEEQAPSSERDAQLAALRSTLASYESQLASENASYASKLSWADARIKSAETALTAVQNDDQELLDSVATVEGTISFQFVSLWDIARLYLPGYSIPAILAVLTVISFLFERRLFVFRRLP